MPQQKPQKQETRALMTKSSAQSLGENAEDRVLPEIVQEHPQDAPPGWADVQEELATSLNLSLLLIDGHQPPALVVSNNNSICHAFQSSPKYVGLCDPYCGDAHRRAMSAGAVVQYKCHAGLQCFTMPVQIGRQQNLAAIGGRAFLTGADYRSLIDRFRAGEFNDLLGSRPFENVIFAEPQGLDQLSQRLEKAARTFDQIGTGSSSDRVEEVQSSTSNVQTQIRTGSSSDRVEEVHSPTSKVQSPNANVEVTTALVEESSTRPEPQPDLQREIDRLRGELQYRSHLAESLQRFLERISSAEPDKTYQAILSHSQELLNAERASVMGFNEGANEITLRAAAGLAADKSEVGPMRLGEGIAGRVLEFGHPLVVANLETAGVAPAPAERNYKTRSFISFPITIGGRKIGVLNATDKAGGGIFNDVDLSLLEIVGPQIAVALERAELQERATQFQLISITDPLTGLLNRRYLEERLTEELNRSKRNNHPISCLMIDIDDFKKYNDRNGHQAGDVALKITAHCLKAALRSADIACRYGGEEFCILLPQTTVSEAGVIAERMRQRVAETEYPHGKSQPLGSMSISIGISTFARHIDTAE
ncbi:MAG: diguanylate cyclase, partial [Acidobacteriota bacterium]|nr:diguanylate cyclase [Acidobacteriota bacterium]